MGTGLVRKPADIEEAIRDIVASDVGNMLSLEELYSIVSVMHKIEELMMGGLLKEIEMELAKKNNDIVLMAEGMMNTTNRKYEMMVIKKVFIAGGNIETDGSGKFSMTITIRKGVSRV
ncbi:hypothetical protein GM182_04800 [bacterium 3DAC]|nr:hypothetical protein GM182_04800 [bacterium 3DAC]